MTRPLLARVLLVLALFAVNECAGVPGEVQDFLRLVGLYRLLLEVRDPEWSTRSRAARLLTYALALS